MTEAELACKLADNEGKAYVIAPAGFGKTHLIAMAVKEGTSRQLILTHTFAGVSALRKKMQLLGVSPSKYKIDTIASWSLRLCLAYPITFNWNIERPSNNDEWKQLYDACSSFLTKGFIQKVIRASYKGFYVDEYQDCSIAQHNLVSALSELLPCRLLGDPLQAIFDFVDEPVNWDEHIYPYFECLGELNTPWRWNNAARNEVGNWLMWIRSQLEQGKKNNLSKNLPKNIVFSSVDLDDYRNKKRFDIFYGFRDTEESVVAIYPGNAKRKTYQLAKNLGGNFSAIEEAEGISLHSFASKMSKATTAPERLKCAIEFAKSCMSNVNNILPAATKRGEKAKISKKTKYPSTAEAANKYYDDSSSANLKNLLLALSNNPETNISRRDLFYRVLQMLTIHVHSANITLEQAANKFQRDFRYKGQPIKHNKIIGTTLLVKGLEFDHAIILDAEALSVKELYVALTRGAKSVTIISKNAILPS